MDENKHYFTLVCYAIAGLESALSLESLFIGNIPAAQAHGMGAAFFGAVGTGAYFVKGRR